MPNENGGVSNNTLNVSTGSNSVSYLFRVHYYNEAECPAKIGDVFYTTINAACAVGGEITLVNDAIESVIIPAGKVVTLNLNGHTLTSAKGNTITNNGELTIVGPGKIDTITDKMIGVQNETGAKCSIGSGVEITRSNDTADATTATTGYLVRNYGAMTIEDGANLHTANKVTSLVTNGWYDTTTAGADDKATLVVNGGTFDGGKINIKNDELGELTLNGGTFGNGGPNNYEAIQNWHIMTIEDGTYAGHISTGKYGKGIGKTVIRDGDFTAAQIITVAKYESDDITIYGGKFATTFENINDYLADGYSAVETDGVLVVSKLSVYEQVDNVINGLDEKGLNIVEDTENDRQYDVTIGTPSFDTVIDEVLTVQGIKKLSVSVEGSDTVYSYVPGTDDLDAFKAQVNALLPQSNTDPKVNLTLVVE